jgi:type II secretory pathway pseudopilin PulG
VEGDLRTEERHEEQGFMLVGLIVAIFIVLLVLGIAAPKMAQELRRDREVEAMHRGNQYVRAIQLYYRKSGSYPGTMDSLAKGTPVKYLRQQYVDPFTGKPDWRLIHVGEAKTTVKGFFGQPLTGMAPGLGSAAGAASSGSIGAGAAGSGSAFGGSSGSAFGGSSGSGTPTLGGSPGAGGTSSSGTGYSSTTGSGTPSAGGATTGTDSSGSGSTPTGSNSTLGSAAGIASQSASSFTGGGAPFVGVGIPKEGTSIVVLNEQTSYNTWEFIYDPRIEQLKAAAGLLGGGNSGLGSAGGMSSGVGGTGPGASGFGSSGTSGFGSSSGSSFGSSSGSSFGSPSSGSSSGSGFGSSPSSGTQGSGTTTPTTPQQPQ